jgi:hypothetical protein
MQAGEPEAAFDGAAVARLEFTIDERFESIGEAEVVGGGLSDRLIRFSGHTSQVDLIQLLLQCGHGTPFGNAN